MISNINFNTMSFRGSKIQPKSETDNKKTISKPTEKRSFTDLYNELQAIKEESNRVHQLISAAQTNDPLADLGLYYSELGTLINKQIELESILRQDIAKRLESNI